MAVDSPQRPTAMPEGRTSPLVVGTAAAVCAGLGGCARAFSSGQTPFQRHGTNSQFLASAGPGPAGNWRTKSSPTSASAREGLSSAGMAAALATGTLVMVKGRGLVQRRSPQLPHLVTVKAAASTEAVESRVKAARDSVALTDFSKLDTYSLAELEEVYIDALWFYYNKGVSLLTDENFEKLKQVLYQRKSRFPTLRRQEVAFVEAVISFYRGCPVVSDEEYDQLKKVVQASGERKDVSAFLLYTRGERLLAPEQYASMKDEFDRIGFNAVDIEKCTRAQLEEMYVDALWAYYRDGQQLLTDDQYNKLKQELEWQASGFPTLRRYEIDFVKASLSYWRGEPVFSDEEWKELKKKVLEDGRRRDVTAFLLYSKGQEALSPEMFEQMSEQMALLGVNVQKAGTKALEQTLSVTSDTLENDISQVVLMVGALAILPTILCIFVAGSLGIFLDLEFVPQEQWGALLTAEALPLFCIGLVGGILLSLQLMVFLDLQNPQVLIGSCPSCSSEVKLFSGGDKPEPKVEYACKSCGCKMVLDVNERVIVSAGLGAKIPTIGGGEEQVKGWRKTWQNIKRSVGGDEDINFEERREQE
eukprot:CAMPEP_0170612786 /NCGR_PEP_ID=MMETSP0224-20130122/23912_1 /TAXON_ID=285029 /ORGANISM="Togula jolla, Strain CCCM 725" /LENGTH=587 /DNA_ID=CAMNT_0010938319 /DNA_START=31 /DNA_END=1795 /DNA_ORIENTATION=-